MELNTNTTKYFTFTVGNTSYNCTSGNQYDTEAEAYEDCVSHMKTYAKYLKETNQPVVVSDRLIIEETCTKIFDGDIALFSQSTTTTTRVVEARKVIEEMKEN